MKKIPLTKGKVAMVDDEDYPYLSRFTWSLSNGHAGTQNCNTTIYMEFFVKEKNKNKRYLFKDRNPLNLQKENIEVVGWGVSSCASKKTSTPTTSKHKGVCWDKRAQKWLAYLTIRKNGKRIKALYSFFDNEAEAAIARNKAAIKIFGETAYQNKI